MSGGAGGGLVVRVWKEWGIQILVVTSFLLQLVLLVFGGFRRRSYSGVLLTFLWLSYLMADNVAVYALGHMALESRPQDDAGLVAFWATFFLLHLGGQDTITAFSLQDNQVWRRHLLTLLVQASGAGYAIYRYTIPGTWTLVSATIVMFIVGFLKYGERVWALQRGNSSDTFALLEVYPKTSQERDNMLKIRAKMDREELILFDAHYMFHFCACELIFINVSMQRWAYTDMYERIRDPVIRYLDPLMPLPYEYNMDMYDLVEAELSLLYDMFYTKAQVVHTWQGCLIRVISLLGTVGAFLLFRLDDGKGTHSRVDISISYVLLVGAIVLETISVFRIVGSTWTCHYLHCQGWNRANAMVLSIRRLLKVGRQRKWMHSIGQHNVLDYCTRDQTKCTNMIEEASTALKKWRRKVKFSVNTKITMKFKELVLRQVVETMTAHSRSWSILDAPGEYVLTEYGIWGDMGFSVKGRDFAHCILIWQVATDIYFCCCDDSQHQSRRLNAEEDDKLLVEAIKVLSNYMGFLMIHPSLLPGGVPSDFTINDLEELWKTSKCSTNREFARSLLDHKRDAPYISLACELLGNKMNFSMLQVIFEVWVEFLCYAAHHSSPISHCGQLGRGGEFLTVIRLVIDHIQLFQRRT
ncbi:uncharacterized protein LOC123399984 [Hordeum vulgare subsp. vulgare]|uniref:uncharacterized protein LOC123399984 n=1 Tax=Hordeum vulgare subsp. vulgare TaxID=112509 RepID=UPI000B483C09|nr:uncharacterized protein LOC123399984 [Hordeum vulgare subsp. vulgare]